MPLTLQNVPEINRLARAMGDFSSLTKQPIPVDRAVNRLKGRAAGKFFAFANSNFGVFGMIATAQFLATLRHAIQIQAVEGRGGFMYIGSAASYAMQYHNGTSKHEPRPFLRNAVMQTPLKEQRSRVPRGLRSGLYQGQKFVDDFAGFFRGDVMRLARRDLGREVSAITWGHLRLGAETAQPNFLVGWANRVIRKARKNIKEMGEDTGMLRHSLVGGWSPLEVTQKSKAQAIGRLGSVGRAQEARRRLVNGTIPEMSPTSIGLSGGLKI